MRHSTRYDWVFLGGIFCDEQMRYIMANSLGVSQNAADAFQKNLIAGLSGNLKQEIAVINLPFVGSYPRYFRRIYFPATVASLSTGAKIQGMGFWNLWGFRLFSRFISALVGLLRFCNPIRGTIFIYSAHLPFILAAVVWRLIHPSVRICLIVPDLPEFMGDGGIVYSLLKRVESKLFLTLARRLNYLVVLTCFMAERMGVDAKKVVVVEGIAAVNDCPPSSSRREGRSFLYSGTLATRYGIVALIDSFMMIEDPTVEMWVCGDGDGRDYVLAAAKVDARIKYFGQISRADVSHLQARATILVNPRTPEGQYTRYSFPSKILEYMASGRPVIMYQLDGIPPDYSRHYIAPATVGKDSLSQCMQQVLSMSDDKLNLIGSEARAFVLSEKNALNQTKKILNLIFLGASC